MENSTLQYKGGGGFFLAHPVIALISNKLPENYKLYYDDSHVLTAMLSCVNMQHEK